MICETQGMPLMGLGGARARSEQLTEVIVWTRVLCLHVLRG